MPTISESETLDNTENTCIVNGFNFNKNIYNCYTQLYNNYCTNIQTTNTEIEIKNILILSMSIWIRHKILLSNTIYKNMSLQKKLCVLDKNVPMFRKKYITVIHYMYKYNIYCADALLLALNTYVSADLSQTNTNSITLWVQLNINYIKFLPKTKDTLKFFGNILQKTNKLISSAKYLEFIPFTFVQDIRNIQNNFLQMGYIVDVLTISKYKNIYENNIRAIQHGTLDARIKQMLLHVEQVIKIHNMLCADTNYVKKSNTCKLQILNSNNEFVYTYTSILYYIVKLSQYSQTAFTLALQNYLTCLQYTTHSARIAWRIVQADYTKYINAELYNFSSTQLNKLWHKTYNCVKIRTF